MSRSWPARASVVSVSTAVLRRSIDSGSRAWTICAQPPRGPARNRGKRRRESLLARAAGATRTVASVRMPSRPSEPSTSWRRSGPAAEAGKGGRSSVPAGVSTSAAGEEVFDTAVAQRLLPAGAGGDPAAQRRKLKRLGKVAQREAPRPQLRLQVRARRRPRQRWPAGWSRQSGAGGSGGPGRRSGPARSPGSGLMWPTTLVPPP